VIAWGEIGLDFHYDHSPREVQRDVFARQLRLAAERRLPVIIHTREAEKETLKVLQENWRQPEIGGILHCYSGSLELAQAGLEMGFWVSFSGMLTFQKAHNVREVAQKVPMERLLIETDAPFLAPVPHRGKRNEPSFVVETAKALAELKGTSIEVIGSQTSENYRRLFNQS
jgi:TatD DNase family protein